VLYLEIGTGQGRLLESRFIQAVVLVRWLGLRIRSRDRSRIDQTALQLPKLLLQALEPQRP